MSPAVEHIAAAARVGCCSDAAAPCEYHRGLAHGLALGIALVVAAQRIGQ